MQWYINTFSYYQVPFDLPMDSRLPLGAIGLGPETHKIPVSTSMAEITGAIYCFFIACSSWEVGSKRPVGINIEKAWNLTFAYSQLLGSCKTLYTRINNECPRWYVHHCGTQRIKHTKGHLSLSCFGLRKFPVFIAPRQAPINAFYYVCLPSPLMCRHPQRRFTVQR